MPTGTAIPPLRADDAGDAHACIDLSPERIACSDRSQSTPLLLDRLERFAPALTLGLRAQSLDRATCDSSPHLPCHARNFTP